MTDLDQAVFSLRPDTVVVLRQIPLTTRPQQARPAARAPVRRARRWSPSDSAVVDQAKGVLMLRYGVGSYESLATLARWSRDVEVSIVEIARTLTRGVCQGWVPADEHGRWLVRWLEQRLREEISEQTEIERWSAERKGAPSRRTT